VIGKCPRLPSTRIPHTNSRRIMHADL
jgi:hypothetical protein